jgi:hypothetical protein
MLEVLRLKLSPRTKARCLKILAGDRRVGMVFTGDHGEDVATFAVALAIWRALTQGKHSVLVGGRPSIAAGWHAHAELVLGRACREVQRDVLVLSPLGLRAINGAWILRFDGPMHESFLESLDAAPRADVLFGDFEWTDRATVDEAIFSAEDAGALSILVVNGSKS